MKRYLLLNDNTIVDTESSNLYNTCENGSFMIIEGNLYFGQVDGQGNWYRYSNMGLHVEDMSDDMTDLLTDDDLVIVKFDDSFFKNLTRPKFAHDIEDYETVITILKKLKNGNYITYQVDNVLVEKEVPKKRTIDTTKTAVGVIPFHLMF